MSLSNIIKIVKNIEFGTLYIKPAFIFQDEDGAVKLQFEADTNSALAYLYDNLCKMMGLTWNYDSPYNDYDAYTNCAMHASGDRAAFGCGPEGTGNGGFCPQMTLAYRVAFQSEDHAAAFFDRGNDYVDYWRSIYPSGVAVGTSKFCSGGGCLGLFLNRFDLYQVFSPNLGGTWVEYNGATFAPTLSPAPSSAGGCDNPKNRHLDKCFQKLHHRSASAVAWNSLGAVGQLSVFLVTFMSVTLSLSIFLARARKKRKRGESYMGFLIRDLTSKKKKRKKKLVKKSKKKKKRRTKNKDLEQDMLGAGMPPMPKRSRSKSKSRRSKSRTRSSSKSKRSKSRSSSRRPDDGTKTRSSSKHRSRSSSKRRQDDGAERPRSSSSRRSRSSSRRRSESQSRHEAPDEDTRRQLV